MANLYISDTLSALEGYLFGTPIESANGLTGNNNVQVEMALRYAVGDVDSSSGYTIGTNSFKSTASEISFVVLGPAGVDPVKVVLSGSGFTAEASSLSGVYGQSAFSINQIQVLSSKTGSIDWNAPVTTLTVDTSINVTSQGRLDNFSLSGITMQEGSLKVALKGALSLGNLIDSSGNVSFSGATFNNGQLEIVYDTNADSSKTELAQITLNGSFTYDSSKSSALAVDGVVSGFGLKVFGGTDLTADPVHYLYGTDLGITLTELRALEGNNWSLATALQHVFDGASDTVHTYADTMIPDGFEKVVIEGIGAVDVQANSQNNMITGNSGDNVIDGAGGTDTFVTSGTLDRALLNADGSIEIKTSTGGTDTLHDVEKVQIGNAAAVDAMSLVTGAKISVTADQGKPASLLIDVPLGNGYYEMPSAAISDSGDEAGMVLADGRVLAVRNVVQGSDHLIEITVLKSSGELDATFGSGGRLYLTGYANNANVAQGTDGSIYLSQDAYYSFGFATGIANGARPKLWKIDPTGKSVVSTDALMTPVDPSTQPENFLSGDANTNKISDLVTDSVGNLYVIGDGVNGEDYAVRVVKLKADLTIDTSYGYEGSYAYEIDGDWNNVSVHGAALGADGSLYIMHTEANVDGFFVRKITSSGVVDNTFGTQHMGAGESPAMVPESIQCDADGNVLIAYTQSAGLLGNPTTVSVIRIEPIQPATPVIDINDVSGTGLSVRSSDATNYAPTVDSAVVPTDGETNEPSLYFPSHTELVVSKGFDFESNNFSLSFSFKTDSGLPQYSNILGAAGGFRIANDPAYGDYLYVTLGDGTPDKVVLQTSQKVNDGQWHDVLLQRSGDKFYLYVDNQLGATGTVQSNFEVDLTSFVLGHLTNEWSSNWDNSFKGWINDFKVSKDGPLLDPTFGTNGIISFDLEHYNTDSTNLLVGSDGVATLVYHDGHVNVVKLGSDGEVLLSNRFDDPNGTPGAGTALWPRWVDLDGSGNLFAGLTGQGVNDGYAIAKVLPNGTLDPTFDESDWNSTFAVLPRFEVLAANGGVAPPLMSNSGEVLATWTGDKFVVTDHSTGDEIGAAALVGASPGSNFRPVAVSDDGMLITFMTSNGFLVSGGAGGVFQLDLVTGLTHRVDVNASGQTVTVQGWSPEWRDIDVSPDGRYVAYADRDQVVQGNNDRQVVNVFVKDTLSGELTKIDTGNVDQYSYSPRISADGTKVLFGTSADLLTTDAALGAANDIDLYVYNLTSKSLVQANIGTTGSRVDFYPGGIQFDLSDDGNTVVMGATNGQTILVRDLAGSTTTSFNVPGTDVRISPNGEFVSYYLYDGTESSAYVMSLSTGEKFKAPTSNFATGKSSTSEDIYQLTDTGGVLWTWNTYSGDIDPYNANWVVFDYVGATYTLTRLDGSAAPNWVTLDTSGVDPKIVVSSGTTDADAGHNYFVLTARGSTSVSRVFDVYIKPLDAGTNDTYTLDTTMVSAGSRIVPLDMGGNPSPMGLDTLDLSGSDGLVGASSDIIVDAKNGEIVYWADGAASSDPVSYTFEGFEKYVLGASTGYFIGRDDLSEYVVIKGGQNYDIVLGSSLSGQIETDIISFEGGQSGVEIALSNADDPNTFVTAKVGTGTAITHQISGAEGVIGSEAADKITGNYADNFLIGNGGNDEISGGEGDDVLVGGAGAGDKLFGGAGGDWLIDLDGGTLRGNEVKLAPTDKANAQKDAFVVNKGATIENFQLSESGTGLAGRAQNANDAIVFNLNLGVIAGLDVVKDWSWVNYDDGMTTAQKEAFSAAVSSHVKFKNPVETTSEGVTSVKLELWMYETLNSDGTLNGREVKVGETTIADVKKASGDQLVIVGLNGTGYRTADANLDSTSFPSLGEQTLFSKSEAANIAIALESVKAGTIRQLPGQVVMSAKWDGTPHFYNPAGGNQKIIATNASDTVELLVQTLADANSDGKGEAGSDKVYDIGGDDTLSFSNAKIEDLHFEAVMIGREVGNQSLKVSYAQTNGKDTNVGDLTWTGHFRSGVDMALDQVTVADVGGTNVQATYQMADTVYKWDKGVFKGVDLVAQAGEDTIMVGQDNTGKTDRFVIKDGFTSNTTVETTDIYIWGLDSNATTANNKTNTLDKIDLSDFGLLDSRDIDTTDTANQTMTVSIANSAGTAADKLVIHLMDTNLTTLEDILVYQTAAA